MSDVAEILTIATIPAAARERARWLSFLELAKPRLSALALVATAVGFLLALPEGGPMRPALLLATVMGTALAVAGANALNQVLESGHDANMVRTRERPLPTGRVSAHEGSVFGLMACLVGVSLLAVVATGWAAFLVALAAASYVMVYTPLKRITPLCVFVGAVPGALPPVVGWTAAGGDLGGEALILFAILYFWQLPHFAAISWQYRDDYASAGYPMLSVVDREGTRLNLHVVTHTVGLIFVSVLPSLYGMTGAAYGVVAMILGVGFLTACGVFLARRTRSAARGAVLASIVYLPLLMAVMLLDKA